MGFVVLRKDKRKTSVGKDFYFAVCMKVAGEINMAGVLCMSVLPTMP